MEDVANQPPENKPLPVVPQCLQIRSILKGMIGFKDAEKYSHYKHCAHTCLWAPWGGQSVFGVYKAAIMMHLRFDGSFGFPGGLIKRGEDILIGVNREMKEEINWPSHKLLVTWRDYHHTQVFGTVRVPLYIMPNKYHGLPAFLNNKFCGSAKQELLMSLFTLNIMSEEEIEEVMYLSSNMKLSPNRF